MKEVENLKDDSRDKKRYVDYLLNFQPSNLILRLMMRDGDNIAVSISLHLTSNLIVYDSKYKLERLFLHDTISVFTLVSRIIR